MSGKCSLTFTKAVFRDMRGGCRWLKDMLSLGNPQLNSNSRTSNKVFIST